MQLTDQELATVLAALRYWQREGLMSDGIERMVATDADTLIALTGTEINTLFEKFDCLDPIVNADPNDTTRLDLIEKGGVHVEKTGAGVWMVWGRGKGFALKLRRALDLYKEAERVTDEGLGTCTLVDEGLVWDADRQFYRKEHNEEPTQ
jgi:hypothetical protein